MASQVLFQRYRKIYIKSQSSIHSTHLCIKFQVTCIVKINTMHIIHIIIATFGIYSLLFLNNYIVNMHSNFEFTSYLGHSWITCLSTVFVPFAWNGAIIFSLEYGNLKSTKSNKKKIKEIYSASLSCTLKVVIIIVFCFSDLCRAVKPQLHLLFSN